MRRCDFCDEPRETLYTVNVSAKTWSKNKVYKKIATDFHKQFPSFRSGSICQHCCEEYERKFLIKDLLGEN